MFQTSLRSIQKVLETDGLKCQYVSKNQNIPFDQLFVRLDVNGLSQEVVLQLRLMEHPLEDPSNTHNENLHLLQFFVALPLKIRENKVEETLRFLSLINRSLEVPGFEFSEVDLMVYYRYVLMTSEDSISTLLIKNLMGVIMFILDSFSTKIEEIGRGKRTLKEVVEEAIRENQE